MGKKPVTDELWKIIEPLLPPETLKPKGGRPRVPDRAALTGIIFVLKSGIPWEMLCPRRWAAVPGAPAGDACATGKRRACGASCTECSWIGWAKPTRWTGSTLRSTWRAWLPKGGERTGPNPTDKGKAGSKRHHVVSDQGGVLPAVILTAAIVHDSNVFEKLVDAAEQIKRPRDRPRERPKKLHAYPKATTPRSAGRR